MMKKQKFDELKTWFEDFDEDKLRGLTEDKSSGYLEHYYLDARLPSKLMTITRNVKKELIEKIDAVAHVDNTARPQYVSKDYNSDCYKILREFKKLTGLPVLVNTSFNIHEEPIVCNPREAISSLKDGAIDVLAIGNYVAERK